MNAQGLRIRFRPDKDQRKPEGKIDTEECYYWRTTGCARGDKCHYKHYQDNEGVDRQPWMPKGHTGLP